MGINSSFGNYDPPAEEDDGVQDFYIGVFFDGTLNNERNTYLRKENEKKKAGQPYDKEAVKEYPTLRYDADSYENDYSNVARMYRFYDNNNQKSIYVEGIGTENRARTDDTRGYLTGTGKTGIPAKVESGCKKVAEKIQEGLTGKKEINLYLDSFGFSRGAAAARHFVYEVTKPKSGTTPAKGVLGKLLEKQGIIIKKFQIRFVGLYDTVSSFGADFNDDVEDLNLDSIRNHAVKNVVQFAAAYECRTNFNLTDIDSAGEKGRQFLIPGAHADVGGCYESASFTQYHSETVSPARVINDRNEYNKIANQKRQLYIDEGWYRDNQIEIGPHSNKYVNHVGLIGTRFIDKRYSYIPLHFMCKLAKEKEANFKTDQVVHKFRIPTKAVSNNGNHILNYVKSKVEQYIEGTKKLSTYERSKKSYKNYLDFTNEKILINGYIHWSATGKMGHGARSDGKRKIING